jgi:hypothetical protein
MILNALSRTLCLAALTAAGLLAQYKVEPAGAPPSDAGPLGAALSQTGSKILKPDGSVLLELWLVQNAPRGGSAEQNTTLSEIPLGSLIGVVRYPARSSDRRGQTIKPGTYSIRYSIFPMNGDHQGAAPQRDFAILSLAAEDTDPAAKPAFDALMAMSKKAAGTPHPLVLSIWKDEASATPGVEAQGDVDQVLHTKIGALPVAIIVVGKHEG